MEFIDRVDYFFNRTRFAFVIDPEPVLITDRGWLPLYDPATFSNIITTYSQEPIFIIDNELLKLKVLMKKDGISVEKAIEICARCKENYWVFDQPIIFLETQKAHNSAYRKFYPESTDLELQKEFQEYQKHLMLHRNEIYQKLIEILRDEPKDSNVKSIPIKVKRGLVFVDSYKYDQFYQLLKEYFSDKSKELELALSGKDINEYLVFPSNANRFVEVFRRLKNNGIILNSLVEIRDWICSHFLYLVRNDSQITQVNFKKSSVYDVLRGRPGTLPRKENCILNNVDWLPFNPKDFQ